ncbi:Zinc-finger containing protein [Phytophthora cinnamomi]|uniref:Zinc-finger containing protein n=1 Tax=Phytophthora cinnamomi TaxID=4785 RepID=UPI00355A6077|nr:Zinc-finger containing protein [Phytophthora cinnamomi]
MQQERESAELCLNGCGFFGAPGSGGMCSVCWKKTMSDRQAAAQSPRAAEQKVDEAATLETAAPAESADNQSAAPKDVAAAAEEAQKPAEKLVQKNKKRCWECKKKVGLTAIECRCGYVFCSGHRYADQHNCSFDFKAADRAELARRNPGGGQFGKLEKL